MTNGRMLLFDGFDEPFTVCFTVTGGLQYFAGSDLESTVDQFDKIIGVEKCLGRISRIWKRRCNFVYGLSKPGFKFHRLWLLGRRLVDHVFLHWSRAVVGTQFIFLKPVATIAASASIIRDRMLPMASFIIPTLIASNIAFSAVRVPTAGRSFNTIQSTKCFSVSFLFELCTVNCMVHWCVTSRAKRNIRRRKVTQSARNWLEHRLWRSYESLCDWRAVNVTK